MIRYTVVWPSGSEDELAEIWIHAQDRPAVTAADDAIDQQLSVSSSKFAVPETRVAGVERSEPPEIRPTGGSLRSTPGTPRSNLEVLSVDASTKGVELSEGLRALFAPPLRVLFAVREDDRLVEVLRVRRV